MINSINTPSTLMIGNLLTGLTPPHVIMPNILSYCVRKVGFAGGVVSVIVICYSVDHYFKVF
jgi:hypothetical protein